MFSSYSLDRPVSRVGFVDFQMSTLNCVTLILNSVKIESLWAKSEVLRWRRVPHWTSVEQVTVWTDSNGKALVSRIDVDVVINKQKTGMIEGIASYSKSFVLRYFDKCAVKLYHQRPFLCKRNSAVSLLLLTFRLV